MPIGKFRQPAVSGYEPMAYVAGDGVAEFVTEAVYRARAYAPPFEELPSQDEYEAAEEEKQDIEADEAADVALHEFDFLVMAMARYPETTDAWRDFSADCEERFNVSPHGGPASILVPAEIWDYWLSVSRGINNDYDARGARTEED